jgi:cob(I)alamin adenosyltransferase
MSKCGIQVYCGEGRGKTTAALGTALRAAARGKRAIIIQFLKEKVNDEVTYIKRLEPEIRFFSFQKYEEDYFSLPRHKQEEELINIKNGLNFAKKVITTRECDVLVLDEVLALVDSGLITSEELCVILDSLPPDSVELILTGRELPDEVKERADVVYRIETMK